MKNLNSWATRSTLVLMAALILGSAVSCKKDDDKDDSTPQPTVREKLVGNDDKRWYLRQEGQTSLALTASQSEIANAPVSLSNADSCDQDDARVFKSSGKLMEWYGAVKCDDSDTTNALIDAETNWSLLGDNQIVLQDGVYSNVVQIKELTNNRLHIRMTYTYDSVYVYEAIHQN